MENELNISDQDILSRFWLIKFIMGIAAILIAFGLPSWFEKYVDLPIELVYFNLIAFLSGILYYIIVLLFLRHSYKTGYFHPESIPNYLMLVAFILSGFVAIFSDFAPEKLFFLSVSGLHFTGISLLAISYYDKNQSRSCKITKYDSSILFQQHINYPIIGLKNRLKVNINKKFKLDEKLPIAILRLENKKFQFPLKMVREFKFLNENEVNETPISKNINGYIIYAATEVNQHSQPKGIAIKNNLRHRELIKVLAEIKQIMPYEIIKIAEGMRAEFDFFTFKFEAVK